MKKAFSIVLVLAMLLATTACGKPAENDAIDFGPGGTAAPGVSAEPGVTAGLDIPGATDPNATIDPNATLDPNATIDPNATPAATLAPGQTPAPGASATPTASSGKYSNYAEAHKINSDVAGWITIPNTNINYPIMYSAYDKAKKDFFYNNHDIYKKSTGSPGAGSIYSYYGDVTRNIIISGHNMRQSGTMFHELHEIQDNKSSLTTKANRTFTVKLPGFSHWNDAKQSKWEVFALYETKDDEPTSTLTYNIKPLSSSSKSDIEAWIAKQKSRSEVKLDVSVSAGDILMTLVTCGDNYDYSDAQSRLYIFLKCAS